MKKVCLVTSTLTGVTNTGGTGTAIYNLALELVKSGNEVTILFCGTIKEMNTKHWEEEFKKLNINFVYLYKYFKDRTITLKNQNWWLNRSYYTLQYFLENEYDIAHFPDTFGHGFHVIQAKKTTNVLNCLTTIITMHSSTEWIIDGGKEWQLNKTVGDKKSLLSLNLNFAERYCCENCDFLLAPSEDMFEWAQNQGWDLNNRKKMLFNAMTMEEEDIFMPNPDYNHFIFFGRLDKRKGLDYFCEALKVIIEKENKRNITISFLGKFGEVDGIKADKYIANILNNKDINIKMYRDFNSFEAIEYIKTSKGLVIMPSIRDNSPYGIAECIVNKVPFITSRIGGIPELVSGEVLFDLSVNSLVEKIRSINNIDFKNIEHKYNKEKANKELVKFHETLETEINNYEIKKEIKISVCLAYRNHGRYVKDLLDSIVENQYSNLEVILVDDGSDDEYSVEKLKNLNKAYKGILDIKILKSSRKTKGEILNIAAKESSNEILAFIDIENILEKEYFEKMIIGLKKSNANILSCHARKIHGIGKPSLTNTWSKTLNIPVGSNTEVNILENFSCTGSFLIEKSCFGEIKGFEASDSYALYWNLMNKSLVKNYKVEIVPLTLIYERELAPYGRNQYGGVIEFDDRMLALQPYFNSTENKYLERFLKFWALGEYTKEDKPLNTLSSSSNKLVKANKRIKKLENKILEINQSTSWKITNPLRKIGDLVKYKLGGNK